MTDTERLNWLEAELRRGKKVSLDMIYNPNVSDANHDFNRDFYFFTVHSQHLRATDLRAAIDTAAAMTRIA